MKDHAQYADALALLAMGALDDPQDLADVQAHLGTCGECRRELEALRADAALLAVSSLGPQPPQRARQRLMEAIAVERRKSEERKRYVVGHLRSRWLRFAPVLVALFLVGTGLLMWRENARLRQRLDQARTQLQMERSELAQARKVADLLHATDAQQIVLVKSQTPPPPQINTIYSRQKGALLLTAGNLHPLPAGKVYELWLLPASGEAPMPAGTFKPGATGNGMMFHEMGLIGIEAKAFALTIEPEGGSSTPTLPIVMSGATEAGQ